MIAINVSFSNKKEWHKEHVLSAKLSDAENMLGKLETTPLSTVQRYQSLDEADAAWSQQKLRDAATMAITPCFQ
jgi:hypothetical protein